MVTEMTDYELIQQIIHNPDVGIQQAIGQYGALVNGVVIKMLGTSNKLDVQECVSNVFIKLWKHSERFDASKGSLKGYIVAIARNEALSKLKALQKDNLHESLENMENDIGVEMDMTSELASKLNGQLIDELVGDLKEPDRQIFIRRYYWGERIKAIAKIMHLEEKFIENRLYLSKRKLRKELIEKGVRV